MSPRDIPGRQSPVDRTSGDGLLAFPDGFRWGAATSAYQIEGAADEDGRGASIWDTFSRTPGRTSGGDTGDVACDHYHRYVEDLDLMASLGLQSYRFSISWPRVQPDGRGAVNPRGLDFYRRLVDGLRDRGISPMATLYHWDLPQRLQDEGGWENRDCTAWFADYAEIMFRTLGDGVDAWLTVNEPKTVVQAGYLHGIHPPGLRDLRASSVVAHHLLLGHGRAVQAFRASCPSGRAGHRYRIGPAFNLAPVYPADASGETTTDASAFSTSEPDGVVGAAATGGTGPAGDGSDGYPASLADAVRLADLWENRLYLDPVLTGRYPEDLAEALDGGSSLPEVVRDGDLAVISSPVDLLGVQYYNPVYVDARGNHVRMRPTSPAGWQQIHPEGLYDLLVRIRRDYGDIPLSITENGLPDEARPVDDRVDDAVRIAFLTDHLAAAHRAIRAGVPLESYHLWSLLDNFEWSAGYSQRWGIVHVDRETGRRLPKASAHWYRQVIAENGVRNGVGAAVAPA